MKVEMDSLTVRKMVTSEDGSFNFAPMVEHPVEDVEITGETVCFTYDGMKFETSVSNLFYEEDPDYLQCFEECDWDGDGGWVAVEDTEEGFVEKAYFETREEAVKWAEAHDALVLSYGEYLHQED